MKIKNLIYDKERTENIRALPLLKNGCPRPSASNKGFSLIELLVAITLFIVIVSVSVSIFLRALKTQKVSLALMEANDSLALTIEGMSREIREGTDFICSPSLSAVCDGTFLSFNDAMTGENITYTFSEGSIWRDSINSGKLMITPQSVEIKDFNMGFVFVGANPRVPNPKYPPRVLIKFSASPRDEQLKDFISRIQTVVSSRLFVAN